MSSQVKDAIVTGAGTALKVPALTAKQFFSQSA
jgi:hypothetical protein